MRVWVLKTIILVSLFILTYIFSLLPIKLMSLARHATDIRRKHKIERLISFLSCFAAGVFLATCLLDLYPEVQETLVKSMTDYHLDQSRYSGYPVSESVMVVGFFLVLIVEQVVLAYKENNMGTEELQSVRQTARSRSRNSSGTSHKKYGAIGYADDEEDPLLGAPPQRPRSASVASVRSITGISNQPYNTHEHDEMGQSTHQDPNSHSPIRSFIMLAALSLHSVFEGLAVGLQTTTETVLGIFGALILHKCIIAFSIGLNLVQSQLGFWAIVRSNAIFCIASPLGILLGILIDQSNDKKATNLTSGILQGLACGTFLYVTFFEVLPHEFNKPKDRVLKLLFVLLGFIFVNGVLFIEMELNPAG